MSSYWLSLSPVSLCLLAAACSSSTSTPATAGGDGGTADSGALTGITDGSTGSDAAATDGASVAEGGASGSGSLTGTYGNNPILPIVAAYWVGMPNSAAETGGGPFVYLFSGPVACADISAASGWVTALPAGTQVTELLVGTTTIGTPVPAAAHAAANAVEANYAAGGSAAETRATSGSVTLTAYTKDVAVDGTLSLTFPAGSATGSFHAVWCATGKEF